MILAYLATFVSALVIGLVTGFYVGAVKKASDDLDDEKEAVIEDSIALVCAWSQGNREEADPSAAELAIRMAKDVRGHVYAGTSPLDHIEEPDGSMAAVAKAFGLPLVPIAPDRREPEEQESQAAE